MPMSFPDMKSLARAAEIHKFRTRCVGETEEKYRSLLADHVNERDFIEGEEIRNKVGWDQFTPEQNSDMLQRRGLDLSDI
jgi:hypothetical protein